MTVRRRVVVHGVVQGVGFRVAARAEAERIGVVGLVRNIPDGTVLVEIEGPPDDVDRMLDWLRRGPPGGRVDRVDVLEVAPVGGDRFEISH